MCVCVCVRERESKYGKIGKITLSFQSKAIITLLKALFISFWTTPITVLKNCILPSNRVRLRLLANITAFSFLAQSRSQIGPESLLN